MIETGRLSGMWQMPIDGRIEAKATPDMIGMAR